MKMQGERTSNRNRCHVAIIVAAALAAAAMPAFAGNVAPAAKTAPAAVAEQYIAIQTALANDTLDQVSRHAAAIAEMTIPASDQAGDPGSCAAASATAIHAAAARLVRAENLKDARAAFVDLSNALGQDKDLVAAGNLKTAYCPMAKEYWLQAGDTIANPYLGSAMLRCGKFVDHVASSSAGSCCGKTAARAAGCTADH